MAAGVYWALMAQVRRKTSIQLCFNTAFIAQLFLLSYRCAHNRREDAQIIIKTSKAAPIGFNPGVKGQEEKLRCAVQTRRDLPTSLKSVWLMKAIAHLHVSPPPPTPTPCSGAMCPLEILLERVAGPLECHSNHCNASLFF